MCANCSDTGELELQFHEMKESDHREAAEYAYAIAMMRMRSGDRSGALEFGRESIKLFDLCIMNEYEDCAARNQRLGCVEIPDLIHQGVVRQRLEPLVL
jgi:hypothetical protein